MLNVKQKLSYPDSKGYIHEATLSPNTFTALELKQRKELAPQTYVLTLALPSATHHSGIFDGQYVAVRAQIKGQEYERFYSPISSADKEGTLELLVKVDDQAGIGMAHYLSTLSIGKSIHVCGPCGGFAAPTSMQRYQHLLFIAKGTGIVQLYFCQITILGIAPLLAIIRAKQIPYKTITLLYANDTPQDILFASELQLVQKVYHLIEQDAEPQHLHGTVSQFVISTISRQLPQQDATQVLICAPPTMSLATKDYLQQAQWQNEQVFSYL